MKRTYTAHSIEETWRVAAEVAEQLTPGMVLALTGDLGAGKTTFMQGIALALGIKRPITSPTFTLCQEYQTPKFKLVHMDLYRLNGPNDLLTIGFPEHLESGAVVAVEWPERGGDLIPPDALHISLTLSDEDETRTIEITRA
jgi:tRNA threonylcarbamoyladenosine biosynthesis protein TsaE